MLRELPIPWDNIPVRQAVAAVAEIKVLPVNGERNVPLDENRVSWRWLLSPDAA
uniref:hypothetical protein n=1 Tax=Actinomadura sp. CA-154981 TaxID=3240037 RepID=UPI003F4965A1